MTAIALAVFVVMLYLIFRKDKYKNNQSKRAVEQKQNFKEGDFLNIADIVVLSIIVVAIVFAVRRIIKKGGSCDCGSTSCPHSNNYNKQ